MHGSQPVVADVSLSIESLERQTSGHTVNGEVTQTSALNQYAENLSGFDLRNPLRHLVPCQYYTYYSHESQ